MRARASTGFDIQVEVPCGGSLPLRPQAEDSGECGVNSRPGGRASPHGSLQQAPEWGRDRAFIESL